MRLLHFADLHIGVENYGRPDPQTGLSTRLLDFLAAYDELVDFALRERVDAVLFAGDAYKSRDPSQTHQREFARRVAKLANEGIPVFLLTGNHDLPAVAGRASALEIFPTLDVQRVFVADHIGTTVVPTPSGPLQVVALPWIRRSQYLAREDTRDLTLDEINARLQETLTSLVQQELDALDPTLPAVLVGHATVSGATTGTERSMMLGRDPVLMLSTLASPRLDYVALGHVHKHQALAYNPLPLEGRGKGLGLPFVAYAGSLQRVDFSEEREAKGFCLVELDPKLPQGRRLEDYRFQPVHARPFVTVEVAVRSGDDPTRRVLDAIARTDIRDAVVRVIVALPEELDRAFREQDVRAALAGAHHVAAIHRNVERPNRTRLAPEASRGLTPTQALRLYLDARSTPPGRAETLLRHAEALIAEEQGEPEQPPLPL
ncbi:MAG: exonuclease SbcCD subunit D [Chloroflexi bacterium]|nr:exonuclease SbcCD subunit D [Chloroflexota bacterium]